ncbi:MAG: cation diffusion facilitator family transporter [Pseudomonadota bacterium]|jgi:cation diffusion facilitator family transporter
MSNAKSVENLTLVAVITCAIELVVSGAIAYISHSLLMMADMFNSAIEFASALVAYLVFRMLRKNQRGLFDYGLGKAENIASLLIALFMLASTVLLVVLAIYRFLNPTHIEGLGVWLALALSIIFFLVNSWILLSNVRHYRVSPSPCLSAQIRLFVIKIAMDLMVIATFVVTLLVHAAWVDYLDTVSALVVVGMLVHSAWNLIRTAMPDLLDQSLSEPLQMIINRVLVKHFEAYMSLDRVRSRTAGNAVFVDIFLGFSPDTTMAQVQPVIDDMRATLELEIPHAEVSVISRATTG